jgi:(p)ppGpp synthase/HD superfamily hydrolase
VTVYAQTNLHLYRQLGDLGYPPTEVAAVASAYELALRLFTGAFRASGKPFLAHLTGVASILASLRARVPIVVTGLLHATYTEGEFGNGWRGVSPARRAEVRTCVGEEIEELVARYAAMTWSPRTIPGIRARVAAMPAVERDVLLVRLANELEDHLDLGVLYCGDAERRLEFMKDQLLGCVEMAAELGFPELGDELAAAFAAVAKAEMPPALRRTQAESFRVPPASHRTSLRVILSHWVARKPWT